MSDEVIFDKEYATLWWHPEAKIVHHQFHKFIHGDDFRELLTRGAELMEKNASEKWLSDDRTHTALNPPDAEWAQTQWFPRVKAAGWKYWAVVWPEKYIGQLNMKRWVDDYGKMGITCKAFTDPEDALKWLESMPESVAAPK